MTGEYERLCYGLIYEIDSGYKDGEIVRGLLHLLGTDVWCCWYDVNLNLGDLLRIELTILQGFRFKFEKYEYFLKSDI